MSWSFYYREQPYLGDVSLATDGQACCRKTIVMEQSCSVLKRGHGSKHSVQMLFVLFVLVARLDSLTSGNGNVC